MLDGRELIEVRLPWKMCDRCGHTFNASMHKNTSDTMCSICMGDAGVVIYDDILKDRDKGRDMD